MEPLDLLKQVLDKAQYYNAGIRSCCPFHAEDTPSFFVFPGKEEHEGNYYYKCHGCGKSGNANRLLALFNYSHLKFSERKVHTPNSEQKKELPFRSDTSTIYSKVYHYYYKRGLSKEICERFGLRFDFDQLRAVIPIYTKHRFQGNVYRNLQYQIKYFIEPEMDMSTALFGYDECDLNKPVICVEGPIDALCCWELGVQAVALISKSSWKRKKDLLHTFNKLIYIGDNDASGVKTSKELFREGFYSLSIPVLYKDINDFLLSDKDYAESYLKGLTNEQCC